MKIILDTNVISELIQPMGSSIIREWLASQKGVSLYTTSITQAEILYGIQILPEGQRRQKLLDGALIVFEHYLPERILAFEQKAAELYSQIAAYRKQIGRPISQFDAQIAAICRVHQATLATRNTRDFLDCGIDWVNPWEAK
ncbi:type II toxin-antitoxin system VapC family toxin [Oscillatoria sp. HE19RPO]|uniref:type II toxin-antitoxin system VapC family toxin n=1 Tax=Oscillatoria sp. HE19RPO TaxID=2954806 RepID=UPI0020C22837|nr:type II toxin-antitoxin system VapC family toxin [Oscillatoria sp. HE19RPO]